MTLFLQQLVNGIALGSVYALVALGLTLVYGVLKVPNFAHGALYTAGAYVVYQTLVSGGGSYVLATLAAVLAVAVIAAVMEWVVFRPLQGKTPVHAMIAALGVLFFLEGTADVIWGPDFRQVPTPLDGVVNVAGVSITEQRVLVIVAAIVTMAALYLLLKRTLVGMSIEAMAQDPEGALLVGIDTRRVALVTFALSGVLAAVAGALIAPLVLVFPTMGASVTLKAFVIVILGGMGSVPGAIVGGYLLALAETMAGTYVAFAFSELIAFAVLVAVLVVRPTGLFARGT
ncbi:MAG TPA: branched-chain amino acid ABC transporter permease [Longimicrobiales bacterium]|nr:branched-chain amino acid ABC transporter permease [Longimicrobiales bacterium]